MDLMRNVMRGLAAGVAGTVVMTGALVLARRAGLLGEPPPLKITRKLLRRGLGSTPPRPAVVAASLAAHVGYGATMGVLHAVLLGRRRGSLVPGALFGAGVWGIGYAGWIPALRLMPPPLLDRPGRPTAMFLAHLIFGATLAAAERGLQRRGVFAAPEPEVFDPARAEGDALASAGL